VDGVARDGKGWGTLEADADLPQRASIGEDQFDVVLGLFGGWGRDLPVEGFLGELEGLEVFAKDS
jgi:hypothetical protein